MKKLFLIALGAINIMNVFAMNNNHTNSALTKLCEVASQPNQNNPKKRGRDESASQSTQPSKKTRYTETQATYYKLVKAHRKEGLITTQYKDLIAWLTLIKK